MARRPARFELTADGGDGHYRLSGIAGFETARALLERGTAEFAGRERVEVDLGGITHADSAGLAVLLTWVARARRAGHAVRFTALPPQLVRIARVCSVEGLVWAAETV
jgi:phospholipid transport system transporter-binding protein